MDRAKYIIIGGVVFLVAWIIAYEAWFDPKVRGWLSRRTGYRIGRDHVTYITWELGQENHGILMRMLLWPLGFTLGLLAMFIWALPPVLVLFVVLRW